jgi:hypothetical protein
MAFAMRLTFALWAKKAHTGFERACKWGGFQLRGRTGGTHRASTFEAISRMGAFISAQLCAGLDVVESVTSRRGPRWMSAEVFLSGESG